MNQGLGIGTGVTTSITTPGLGASGVGSSGVGGSSLTSDQLSPVINQQPQMNLSTSPSQQGQLSVQLQNQIPQNPIQPHITPGISTIGSLATNQSPTNQNSQINQGYYQYNYELPPIVANDWDYMIESNPLNYKTTQYPSLPIPNQQVNPMGMTYGYQTSIPSMNMGVSNSISNATGLSTSLPGPPQISIPNQSGERKKRRNTTTVSNMTPQTAARNRCPICQKQFKRPSSLQTHIYSHTGEKLFKCPWQDCGKLFSVKSNMTRHYKLHQRDNN
ncbi:hypothetical protein CLIB1444_02S13520 [[Candida] jaroonii]|uniref:Uncharacterized protein n=1 Tax=[Candida] jaroonii TaxID=467808 RepID=A0ACA9Y403_9ASCO|nr:hypothetical protein CLIB1444_02S13520 [[Candida] jaroonii]